VAPREVAESLDRPVGKCDPRGVVQVGQAVDARAALERVLHGAEVDRVTVLRAADDADHVAPQQARGTLEDAVGRVLDGDGRAVR
jgi:hypothetical protein